MTSLLSSKLYSSRSVLVVLVGHATTGVFTEDKRLSSQISHVANTIPDGNNLSLVYYLFACKKITKSQPHFPHKIAERRGWAISNEGTGTFCDNSVIILHLLPQLEEQRDFPPKELTFVIAMMYKPPPPPPTLFLKNRGRDSVSDLSAQQALANFAISKSSMRISCLKVCKDVENGSKKVYSNYFIVLYCNFDVEWTFCVCTEKYS